VSTARVINGGARPEALSEPVPKASVIVAVYNAQATVRECLASLLQLDYPASHLELLCVDNGSTDATPRLLAEYDGKVRLLHRSFRGPAAARNHGVRHATGEVVALTDADCVVDPSWLRNLVVPLQDPQVGIVGGRILSRRPCNMIEAFGEQIHDHGRAMNEFNPPYVITMNWASRLDVFTRLGLFNEALLRSSDVDCAYRMVQAGYRLVYEPTAIVYHRNERTPWGLAHEGYVHGFHAPRVAGLHAAFIQRARAERKATPGAQRPVVRNGRRHWSDPMLWALFNFGKRVGRWHAGWAIRRARP